jgi:carboxymethylenebutenolidase
MPGLGAILKQTLEKENNHMMNWSTKNGEKRGYLALPASGEGPGVLVLHAWWGLTEMFTDLCDRLAEAGFVAFAPDMFEGQTGQMIDQAEHLVQTADDEAVQAIVISAVDYLRQQSGVRGDKIGVMGFSFGAAWALLAATDFNPTDIGAVVLFYGNHGGLDETDFAKAEAAFLGHYAEDDPYEPTADTHNMLAEIKKGGKEAEFHFYPGTGHWFMESNRPDAYQAEAANLAWERTLDFLQEKL